MALGTRAANPRHVQGTTASRCSASTRVRSASQLLCASPALAPGSNTAPYAAWTQLTLSQSQLGLTCSLLSLPRPGHCGGGRAATVVRSANSPQPGPLNEGVSDGATRGFKRRAKTLLKKKSGDPSHSGAGEGSAATGPVTAAAAAVAVMTAPLDTAVETSNIVPGCLPTNNMSRHRALVLDCAYRPINVITWAKAVMMDWARKAEVIEYYPPPATAVSGQGVHALPAVIRVTNRYLDLNEIVSQVSCTRRNVLVRDKFTCQYCGCNGRDTTLTIDHVTPVSKGGRNTWINLVTACMACNQRKGDKMLQQLGWKLRSVPKKPTPWELGLVVGLGMGDVERPCAEWAPYLEPYRQKITDIKRRAHEAGVDSSAASEDEQ